MSETTTISVKVPVAMEKCARDILDSLARLCQTGHTDFVMCGIVGAKRDETRAEVYPVVGGWRGNGADRYDPVLMTASACYLAAGAKQFVVYRAEKDGVPDAERDFAINSMFMLMGKGIPVVAGTSARAAFEVQIKTGLSGEAL